LAAIVLVPTAMKHALLPVTLVLAAACASAPPASTPSPTPAAASAGTVALPRNVLADIPNERVDYWVERFTNGDKKQEIADAFARKPALEAMISEKLRRRGLPQELIYLAMAESGLNPQAHSTAEAVGIWQLVPATARQWGLTVDDTVDERRDPEKSTDAALTYLSFLYDRFGSWYLAAAAYNLGENRVARIMTEVTGAERGTDADYYRIWDRLPPETRDFIPGIIALMRMGR
jgi:membrane-bound lytic murein transglycosylase D